jgi:hypothetical protein
MLPHTLIGQMWVEVRSRFKMICLYVRVRFRNPVSAAKDGCRTCKFQTETQCRSRDFPPSVDCVVRCSCGFLVSHRETSGMFYRDTYATRLSIVRRPSVDG